MFLLCGLSLLLPPWPIVESYCKLDFEVGTWQGEREDLLMTIWGNTAVKLVYAAHIHLIIRIRGVSG